MHTIAQLMCAHPKLHLCYFQFIGSFSTLVELRVLNSFCDFSHVFGSIVDAKEGGATSMKHLLEQ